MNPRPTVHQYDPDREPDSAFAPGTFRDLVAGRRGRLLDPRRTPIAIRAVRLATGDFECEVLAFEDRGARWVLPLASVHHMQFPHGGEAASADELRAIERAVAAFDRPLEFRGRDADAAPALERLTRLEREARDWLERRSSFVAAGAPLDLSSRRGDERLWADLDSYWPDERTAEIERRFTGDYVSNPNSGEVVKGHLITLARLGLADYRGQAMRERSMLEGAWSEARRAEHLLRRLAWVRALFGRLGLREVRLHRGFSGTEFDPARAATGLQSASFSRAVAESMLGPPDTERAGFVTETRVPVNRLFMTYLETRAMNGSFEEAEAVFLIPSE